MPKTTDKTYYPALDALRALAVFLVLMHHAGFRLGHLFAIDPIAEFLVKIGWMGVDLFFAISGYLIVSILKRTDFSVTSFFIKRAFRILPLYYVAIISYAALAWIFYSETPENLLAAIFLLTGWAVAVTPPDNLPYLITWSISVEETAYLLYGIVAALSLRSLKVALWASVAICLFLRLFLINAHYFQPNEVYYFPGTRVDSIAIGGIFALYNFNVFTEKRLARASLLLAATAVLLSLLSHYGQHNFFVASFGYTALSILSAFWVSFLVSGKCSDSTPISIFIFIGKRSYFIYLFHVFIIALAAHSSISPYVKEIGFWMTCIAVVCFTTLLSAISWKYFEQPLLEHGHKLTKR